MSSMKIAVVGAGVSGLAATWLLNEHSDHEVHLFEADDRAGGHANTVGCPIGDADVFVDTGFVVFNPTMHLNFLRFLSRYPHIVIIPTETTFSVSRDNGMFEWASNSLTGVFCQPLRLLDPRTWRLLYDILRFNVCARTLVDKDIYLEDSVAEYLAREGYSDTFRDDYLVEPMTASIWSAPPDKCLLELPAQTLVRFLSNHHLLQITGRPAWLTIKGGSRHYVNAILEKLPNSRLHLSTPITSVGNASDGTVQLATADGRVLDFDHVIIACHSDTALALLRAGSGATKDEEEILGRFTWTQNEVVLHSDVNLMPKCRSAWSSWNYLTYSVVGPQGTYEANVNKVSLTYHMNRLQHLCAKTHGPVFVTLNPPAEPAQGSVSARFRYDHPVLNSEALISMRNMGKIQNVRGILYAGAWLGYGFHEDGFTSGLRAVAEHLPVRLPFEIAFVDRPVPSSGLAARVFDLLEWSGVRRVVGTVLSSVLVVVGSLVLAGDIEHDSGSR